MGELEDSLILAELFELYQNAVEREARMHKVVAAAMGADVSEQGGGNSEYSSSGVPLTSGAAENSLQNEGENLPPGVGYTKL